MVKEDDMKVVYRLARQNKRRSEDAVAFELHYEFRISKLVEAINNRSYRCYGNYTFVSLRPKPREVFGCELETRLIQWYVIWRILPILEVQLTSRTFNNRKGMGTDAAIRQLHDDMIEVSQHFTRDAWIITYDVQGYFPNANCDLACEQLQRLIKEHYDGEDKEDLLWMVMIAVHSYPAKHCYRKSPLDMWALIEYGKSLFNKPDGVGGAIGFLIWQVAMNLYLDDVDHWAIDEMGLHYVRYVDDTAMVVENKDTALLLLPEIRRRFTEHGIRMHPNKFSCQHVTKGVHFLGSYIKYERIYVHNRCVRNAAERIRLFNRCHDKEGALQNFIASLNSTFGLLKSNEKYEYNTAQKILSMISQDWFKYVVWNNDRGCLEAKPEYSYNKNVKQIFEKISNPYNI